MRKFLFILIILMLCAIMYFVVWNDIPSIDMVKTYTEVQDEYSDYQQTLQTLKNKNDVELPALEAKLNPDYTESDTDNVIKLYNDNKKYYEELVALQRANNTIESADIYDIEYIWTVIGDYASNCGVSSFVTVEKSEADLDSPDYIMCNLKIEAVGSFSGVAEFIDEIELDTRLAFQINDFFMEGYNKTSVNQDKDTNMDTDNIVMRTPDEITSESSSSEQSSSTINKEGHVLDVRANFTIYNIPLNRRNVTNVKNPDVSLNLTSDDDNLDSETEENVVE